MVPNGSSDAVIVLILRNLDEVDAIMSLKCHLKNKIRLSEEKRKKTIRGKAAVDNS